MAQGAPLSHEYPRTAAGTCGRASMRCTPRGCTQLPVHAWPAWPSTARASGAVAFDIDAAVQDSASSARSGECVIKASSRARRMEGHSRDDGWRQDQPPINSQEQLPALALSLQQLIQYPSSTPKAAASMRYCGSWVGVSVALRTAQSALAGSKSRAPPLAREGQDHVGPEGLREPASRSDGYRMYESMPIQPVNP